MYLKEEGKYFRFLGFLRSQLKYSKNSNQGNIDDIKHENVNKQ